MDEQIRLAYSSERRLEHSIKRAKLSQNPTLSVRQTRCLLGNRSSSLSDRSVATAAPLRRNITPVSRLSSLICRRWYNPHGGDRAYGCV